MSIKLELPPNDSVTVTCAGCGGTGQAPRQWLNEHMRWICDTCLVMNYVAIVGRDTSSYINKPFWPKTLVLYWN